MLHGKPVDEHHSYIHHTQNVEDRLQAISWHLFDGMIWQLEGNGTCLVA